MKACSKCKQEKLETDFTKTQKWCKSCVKIANTEWNKNNKDKRKKYKQTIEYKVYNKKYKQDNKEQIQEWGQQYYLTNKDQILKNSNDYYHSNKSKRREYENNRMKTDPAYKLRKNISAYLRSTLKNKNRKSIIKYLPYSLQELKDHLEYLFEPWMSWDNWTTYNPNTWDNNNQSTWTWQIDHIIPQSKFNYLTIEDEGFKKCWALTNLRPYSAKQNLLDGSRRAAEIKN